MSSVSVAEHRLYELLRLPRVGLEVLAGLGAQVTQGAAGVGLILVIPAHGGSLALAGTVVGALWVAAAVGRPIQGMLIDRRGASGPVALCGVVHTVALCGIVALAAARGPGVSMIALAVVCGLALPPVSTSMRAVWGAALPASERTAAYSLVYLTQEISILAGPLLLSTLTVLANTSLALVVIAVLAGGATLALAGFLARRPHHRSLEAVSPSGGALRSRGLWLLVAVAALIGGVLGALQVAVPTTATAHGAPAASGALFAALGVGGIIGAVIYGGRRWSLAPAARLLALLGGLAGAVALTVPGAALIVLGGLLLIAGLCLNPALTTLSLLVDEHVPHASAAEAFGWLSLGIAAGTGAGSALAGALTASTHPRTGFAIAAIFGVAAALLVLAAREALGRRAGLTPS
jgi:MFS family permease